MIRRRFGVYHRGTQGESAGLRLMSRIIKPSEVREGSVNSYERDALEAIVPEHFEGKDYVDPAVILAEAREEAERKVREAFEEGIRRGMKSGQEKFNASVGEAEQVLNTAADALKAARNEFLEGLEPRLVQLATAIAEHILKREAELSHDLVKSTTRAALEHIIDQERVVLRVNPADLDVIRKHRITLLDEFDGIKQLDVVADESIESGGCVATSEQLHVDAQIETQIQKILEKLGD